LKPPAKFGRPAWKLHARPGRPRPKRAGRRGEGKWERVTWDEALDAIAARIRKALKENRPNEIMVHLGRPGEDGYTERVLASWGVDGHNSHTNVCSSGGRAGFQFWMGIDRPSPDYAHAKVIYLISAHLETGHYFNPHAQRITQARENGAKVIVLDTRLSNTATHADYWLSPQPGSEAAINLAIARYLIASGQTDKARAVLTKVEGGEHVEDRIAEIRAVMSSEKKARFRDLLGSNGFLLPIVVIGIGLSVFQQFVGINVIFYYSSLLWQSVGYNVSNSLLLSVSTSIVNVVGTVVAISVIDRIGRKPLALIGSFGMSISLAVVAFAFSHVDKASAVASIPKGYGTLAIVGAHVYVFFFAMSWGVVVWVLLGEMFPNKIRALALSVAASFQWLANFAISQSFPTMSRWSLSGSYIIYACFAFLSIPFILKFVKETKGKKLEDFG